MIPPHFKDLDFNQMKYPGCFCRQRSYTWWAEWMRDHHLTWLANVLMKRRDMVWDMSNECYAETDASLRKRVKEKNQLL